MPSEQYDVVVIGSGLGGLLCAVMLAKEGMKVCVLEKNKQAGGALQSFAVHKKPFDSCVHYIGGLGEGHTMNKLFAYAGIMDELKLYELDRNGFDRIAFAGDELAYPIACKEHFVDALCASFPDEESNLEKYLLLISEVTSHFPLYNLRNGDADEKQLVAGWELTKTFASITENKKLRQVLAGNNLLYAGVPGKTPFYLHALVTESYLHSAHKVAPVSSEITKLLMRELRKHGGVIHRSNGVSKVVEQKGQVQFAVTETGERFYAKQFIANMAPSVLLPMLESDVIRPAFRKRIAGQSQTISSFMLNLVLKPGMVKHRNYNIYWHLHEDVYAAVNYKHGDWPANYATFFTEDRNHPGFSDTLSVLAYMHFEELKEWERSENSVAQPEERGDGYERFKMEKSELLLERLMRDMPELHGQIVASSSATPLTYRDYTGTPEGSLYGILKDVEHPAQTTIATRTRIPNLFFTGQNVNLHGVLGVSITAVATCAELLGMEYLLGRINQGQK